MNPSGAPTISINCELLTTVRIAPALTPVIQKYPGLPANTPVLASGGAGIKSSGDIRFVVIGAQSPLVPERACSKSHHRLRVVLSLLPLCPEFLASPLLP